jgi:hypothetical protein
VYALLHAVLARLPGILKFSRRLLNYVSIAAVIASVTSAKIEFASGVLPSYSNFLSWAVAAGIIFERVIFTVALIVLLAIIVFVLWFPVEIPRNLILFCFGLLIYLSCRNAVLLADTFWANKVPWLGAVSTFVLAACCVYWAVCITPEGEHTLRRVRHERPDEHERLVRQLESMNAALLRGVRN